jgi:hypothetical protein
MDAPRSVEYYAPAGRFSAGGFTVAVIGGAAASATLGFLYGSLQVVMPILYLCFLVTVLFATALGHLVFFFVKLGHARHLSVASTAAVVGGLSAMYGAWVADRWVRCELMRLEGVELSFAPSDLFTYMGVFFEHGFWSLFMGVPMFGVPLALIWLAEAAIIVGLALLAIRSRVRATPYCEPCRRWTAITRGIRMLMPQTSHAITEELKKGNVNVIHQTLPSSRGAPLALRVDVAQCPTCAQSVYLSVTVVSGGTRFREFVWPQEKALVRHLRIAPADVDALRAPQKLAQIVVPGKTRPKRQGTQESAPPDRP